MNDLARAGLALATGGGVAALLIPPLLLLSRRVGAYSGGTLERWNPRSTPVLGGVAIFGGSAVAGVVSLALLGGGALGELLLPSSGAVFLLGPGQGLLLAGFLVFLLGLVDDLIPLPPVGKLAGQVAAAGILLISGLMLRLTGIYPLDAAVSVVWFVGITNAVNLMDNMDGAAGGVAGIVALYLGALLLLDGNLVLALLAFGVAGAVGGFLFFNYPPARIFMGDSGALFLGTFLAGLALAPTPGLSRGLFAVLAVPLLVMAVPILDTTLVTVTRLWEGRSVSQGGRDHTSHRLARLGLPEERVVWFLWGLAAAGGGVAFLFRTADRELAYLLGGTLLSGLVLLAAYLARTRIATSAPTAGMGAAPAVDSAPGGLPPLARRLARFHARWPVLALVMDAGVVILAYWAAYVLRWEEGALGAELAYFQLSLPIVLASKIAAFSWVGVYRQRYRQVGLHEAMVFLRANLLGTLVMAVLLLLLARSGFSRGVLVIDFLVCTAFTLGTRVFFRYLDGVSRRWGREGIAALVVVSPVDAEWSIALLERWGDLAREGEQGGAEEAAEMRLVGVVHPQLSPLVGSVRGLPAFGGEGGLERAIQESGARRLVVVGPESVPEGVPSGVSVLRLRQSLEDVEGAGSGG